jgi:UDP-N-acetylmuramoyl-L-alanyl-D-glutamate--2,6-diaminopimelate ligase
LERLPGSLETVAHAGDFAILVDDAHDVPGLESSLRGVRELSSGRILLLLGAGERTTGRDRFALGQCAARYAAHVVLTSDNPGREAVEQICSGLAQGLEAAGHTSYHFQPDRKEAIGELLALARPGDVVILSGKGERTYQEFGSTIVPFDDRLIAAEKLAELVPARPRFSTEERTLLIA